MRTWILVGDAARARIFLQTGNREPLVLLHELNHPQSRAKGTDINTDQGWSEPGVLPKDIEAQKFAHQVAQLLEREHSQRFDQLIIIAPPNFLGMLRNEFSEPVRKKVIETQRKDLTHLKEHELVERLQVP